MLRRDDDLSIEALAAAASAATGDEVKERTIRFYQQEGLLDPPGVRGVKVFYGEADVKRIELIKAYQKEKYSLAGIRDRLRSMDDGDVTRELQRLRERRKSAADYARSIRMGTEREAPHFGPERTEPFRDRPRPPGRSRGTWERISLTPHIELHVRSPLSHHETKLVSRLVELADRLINTGEGL
jgi:DNA-binding transcriptional MerR regulator